MADARIYKGQVFHKRFSPKEHQLTYKVFTLYTDIDDFEGLDKSMKFFSLNRFNFMSLYENDYGNPAIKGKTLKSKLLELLTQVSIGSDQIKSIKMLTYPRINGYVFNPLTVFYCFGENGEHMAIIYEVRNTFGERHNYIYPVPEGKSFNEVHHVDKCFHVSPFFDRKGEYLFKIEEPSTTARVIIDYFHKGELLMTANFVGEAVTLTDKTVLFLCLKAPFMTLKVFAGILYEAIKLKFKGLHVFKHPEKHNYQSTIAVGVNEASSKYKDKK